jgi:hypothetical protein
MSKEEREAFRKNNPWLLIPLEVEKWPIKKLKGSGS